MATTSKVCALHDQVLRGKPRSHRTEDAKYKDQEKKLPEATAAGRLTRTGRPTTPSARTTARHRKSDTLQRRTNDADRMSDTTCPEPKRRTSDMHRTTGPSRASGRPVTPGRPTPVHRFVLGRSPCTPSPPSFVLDYIYSTSSNFLGLALV